MDILMESIIRYIVSCAGAGKFISDDDLLIQVAKVQGILERMEKPVSLELNFNNLMHSFYSLRDHFSKIRLAGIFLPSTYVSNGVSVSYNVLAREISETGHYIYLINYDSYRNLFNSPTFILPLLGYPNSRIKVINFAAANVIEIKEISDTSFDLESAAAYIDSVCKAIYHNLVIPIFKCSRVHCPYYSKCHITKRIKK